MNANELLTIKESLNEKVREQDRLLGRKETLLEQLNKLGCSSFEEAEETIEDLEKDIDKLEEHFQVSLADFKKTYGNLL